MGIELGYNFISTVFLDTYIFNLSWLTSAFLVLLTMAILTRDYGQWKSLAFPVMVGWHIAGVTPFIGLYVIAGIMFAIENLSLNVVTGLATVVSQPVRDMWGYGVDRFAAKRGWQNKLGSGSKGKLKDWQDKSIARLIKERGVNATKQLLASQGIDMAITRKAKDKEYMKDVDSMLSKKNPSKQEKFALQALSLANLTREEKREFEREQADRFRANIKRTQGEAFGRKVTQNNLMSGLFENNLEKMQKKAYNTKVKNQQNLGRMFESNLNKVQKQAYNTKVENQWNISNMIEKNMDRLNQKSYNRKMNQTEALSNKFKQMAAKTGQEFHEKALDRLAEKNYWFKNPEGFERKKRWRKKNEKE